MLQDKSLTLDAGTILMPAGTGAENFGPRGTGEAVLTVVEVKSGYFPPVISAAVAERIGVPATPAARAQTTSTHGRQLWLAVDRSLAPTNELLELRQT